MHMNKTIKLTRIVILGVILSSATAYAASVLSWKIDKSHTGVNFTTTHFFSDVTGNFKSFEGTINFDPNNLTESNVTFTIPVNSINTGDEKRDKHLQSADFFDAKKFPEMKFISSSFSKKEDGTYMVYGNLTIKDVTKKVGMPFKITGQMEHPMMKGTEILGISLLTKIDRTMFGVGTGSWSATAVVGDEVTIKVNMELNRKK